MMMEEKEEEGRDTGGLHVGDKDNLGVNSSCSCQWRPVETGPVGQPYYAGY